MPSKVLIFLAAIIVLSNSAVTLFATQNPTDNAKPATTTTEPDSIRTGQMPQIEVVGVHDRFERIPGSAILINMARLNAIAQVSGNEVFRQISGLHAVDEEGIGLRANIGIRGLDPDRSRTVLILEDGIPVALNPYGEPELYYTPSMDRMVGVEVLKGSGSIVHGPQTFGGVINYLTANPPPVPTATAHVRGGEGGYFVGRFGYGTTFGNTGIQTMYLFKRGDNVGILDYNVHDLNTKIKLVLADNSIVGIKFGFYDETSNSTYVGITQAMYDTGLYDFEHPAPNDRLDIRRYSASIIHDYYFSDNVRLKTTAYGYTTTRNWGRQDFDNIFNPSRTYDYILGDPTRGNYHALYFRNTTGNRNRQFEVAGIEPRLSMNFDLSGFKNELDLGTRFLFERAYEQRIDGTTVRPKSGTLREDEIRTGRAISTYIQNRIFLTDAFTVTPGVRFEKFWYEREILRRNNAEVDIRKQSSIHEIIPGVGFNYKFDNGSSMFAGAHRGFGPPRTKDAITAAGVAEDLDAELSWNFELGTRQRFGTHISAELTLFLLNFTNQIIPVAESAGGVGTGLSGLINGGETGHRGIEGSVDVDFGRLFNLETGIYFRTTATYTRATFSSDRYVASEGMNVNVKGNTLPYAPEFLLNQRVDVRLPIGVSVGLDGTYIADQYGDVLNMSAGSDDGRNGKLPAYYVLNGTVSYDLPAFSDAKFTLSVKNLLDERYIVSRRPQGIRVGLPRFVTAGFDITF